MPMGTRVVPSQGRPAVLTMLRLLLMHRVAITHPDQLANLPSAGLDGGRDEFDEF